MKKNKKILNKVKYEEDPWDDESVLGEFVEDFLPSPAQLKNARIKYIDNDNGTSLPLPLATKDIKSLHVQAKKAGLSPEAFIIGVMHDFLTGKLIRQNN